MKSPTKKQTVLLEFISEFSDVNNYSPSYREIMQAMNLRSVSAVAEHIENCVASGFLKKVPKSPRSLEVIKPKNYDETKDLFRQKIAELENKGYSEKELETLSSAAHILGIVL